MDMKIRNLLVTNTTSNPAFSPKVSAEGVAVTWIFT